MKRIISFLLILIIVLSFSACSKGKEDEKETKSVFTSTTKETTKKEKEEKKEEESSTEKETTKVADDSTTKKSSTTEAAKFTTTTKVSRTTTTSTAKTTTTTTKKATSSNVINNNLMSSFSVSDMNGNTVTQAILKGKKVTMFNVWWTQCSPCIAEMPDLATLNVKYTNFQVIGIVWDYTNTSTVNSIITQTGANYTHIQLAGDMYSRLQTAGYEGYVPFTFFVDENGNQLKFTYGGQTVSYMSGAVDWEPIILELLG